MARSSYGTGTIFKSRNIWYVSYWVDGKQVQKSSGSANIQDAKRLRDQILGKQARGEIVVSEAAKITCRELLDDLLAHYEAGNAKPTTTRVFRWCIDANLKPYFGDTKAATLSTPKLKAYRDKRKADGVTETTCNDTEYGGWLGRYQRSLTTSAGTGPGSQGRTAIRSTSPRSR